MNIYGMHLSGMRLTGMTPLEFVWHDVQYAAHKLLGSCRLSCPLQPSFIVM